jgi:hypothetical protein
MGKKVKKLQQQVRELRCQMSAQYTVTREHAERLRVLERMAGEAGACEPTIQFDQPYARGYNSPIINSTFVSRCSKHGDYTHHLVGQQCPQCVAANTAAHQGDGAQLDELNEVTFEVIRSARDADN